MFFQFLTGCFVEPDYVDSYARIAMKNLTSLSGFWFDCVTSMPWSYMDSLAYQASAALARGAERGRGGGEGGVGERGGGQERERQTGRDRDRD